MPKKGANFWYGVGFIGVVLIVFAVLIFHSPADNQDATAENPQSENTPADQNQSKNEIVTDPVETPNVVLATVNGEQITIENFQTRVRMQRAQLISELQFFYDLNENATDSNIKQQYEEIISQYERQLEPEQAGQIVLDQMISAILIRQEAQGRGIQVTTGEVTEMMNSFFGYYPNGYPTFTPSPNTEANEGEQAVEVPSLPQPTSITEEEYNQALEEYSDSFGEFGVTEEILFSIFEAGLYREKFSEVLAEGISNQADQVHARHILVEDRETAESILERLENGETWEDLALELSIDTSNSANGGDLGWFSEGTMVQEFNDAAFGGDVGTIVGPVETQFGFHLIDIIGHESQPLPDQKYDFQVNLALTDLINQIKTLAEGEGRIVVIDDWVNYTPDDPKYPESTQ